MRMRSFVILTVLTALLWPPARASGETSAAFEHSSVRLLAGGAIAGEHYAGVELELKPGWKTYWRMPGEAGVPPQFDWGKSVNLASAKVKWPAPARYSDKSGETIGYSGHVIFPVAITARDGNKPVHLALTLHYALCRDICIPAKATLAIDLPAGAQDSRETGLISGFLKQVPQPATASGPVRAAHFVQSRDGRSSLRIALDETIRAPVDIFVEGADDLYFRKPRKVAGNIFELAIDGRPSAEQILGKTLTVTVSGGARHLVQAVVIE